MSYIDSVDKNAIEQYISQIYIGDNLELMRELPASSIDLIYIDPPFNTGKSQRGSSGIYDDSWETMDAYLSWLRPRLTAMHLLLCDTGSILVHVDWRTSHHIRLMLEGIFGTDCFVNHLIWSYGLGGSSPRRFARKHDDILFFSRGESHYFEPPMIQATSQRMQGQMKKATDVIDIPSLNNMAHERTGYPTQKPVALLELLINACSPANGIVADFFCGSGTTLVAAKRTGRRWLGADISMDACDVAQTRLS